MLHQVLCVNERAITQVRLIMQCQYATAEATLGRDVIQ